ncbi:MAG: hypothetical protein NT027_16255 [Proteobacteria bacterium]|nr:hypothetical protein [Pseudomonadota bacterium]
MTLHIIFTNEIVILSKKGYRNWREIQDEFESYKASLGPWTEKETIEWLCTEYPNLKPSAHEQVSKFVSDQSEMTKLTFNGD